MSFISEFESIYGYNPSRMYQGAIKETFTECCGESTNVASYNRSYEVYEGLVQKVFNQILDDVLPLVLKKDIEKSYERNGRIYQFFDLNRDLFDDVFKYTNTIDPFCLLLRYESDKFEYRDFASSIYMFKVLDSEAFEKIKLPSKQNNDVYKCCCCCTKRSSVKEPKKSIWQRIISTLGGYDEN